MKASKSLKILRDAEVLFVFLNKTWIEMNCVDAIYRTCESRGWLGFLLPCVFFRSTVRRLIVALFVFSEYQINGGDLEFFFWHDPRGLVLALWLVLIVSRGLKVHSLSRWISSLRFTNIPIRTLWTISGSTALLFL